MPRPHSSVDLSPDIDLNEDSVDPIQLQTKRKRPSGVKADERKKVSRACDACKERKVRCAGTQPCPRCINQSVQCLYNKTHRRGKPSPPRPGLSIHHGEQNVFDSPSVQSQYPPEILQDAVNQNTFLDLVNPPRNLSRSSRNSQEADDGRLEGDYIGPTSGIAFLHRAQKRFQQDYAAIKSLDAESQNPKQVSVFSFGDGWTPEYSGTDFSLPSLDSTKALLDRYFEFAMPTYRFVDRSTVEMWLSNMLKSGNKQESGISNAKRATVVLVLATAKLYNEDVTDLLLDGQNQSSVKSGLFFAEAERLLSEETGPVRLESVQARLAQCIHLLASSRVNQAWYIFGTVSQMIYALGLHRKRKPSPLSQEVIKTDCRKRVFWSAYTLDRYLSVILGRPRIFRDEDIDQSFQEESSGSADTSLMDARTNMSVSDGPVFHARLARILGGISSDLYTSRSRDSAWDQSAARWTAELKQWRESLPAFLEPTKVDPSMLVPIYQRQSTVLRLAYAHALILANRPALLSSFADLSRWQGIPVGEPTGSLKECIDAAVVVVTTVNRLIEFGQMRKAFWFTHYISFCAISALYVYTIQQRITQERLNIESIADGTSPTDIRYFEAAKKCQKRIEDTTTMTSPFRRYNIILDELKKEVEHRLGPGTVHPREGIGRTTNKQARPPIMDSSGGTPSSTPTDQNHSSYYMLQQPPQSLQSDQLHAQATLNNPIEVRPGPIFGHPSSAVVGDSIMIDMEVFGFQGEFMGWSEFDSCAINWSEELDHFDAEG